MAGLSVDNEENSPRQFKPFFKLSINPITVIHEKKESCQS